MRAFMEIVAMALKNEEEGARFYRETAKKSKDPLVSATFEFLAKEEDKHIRLFREYAMNNKFADPESLKHPKIDPRDKIKKIFDKKSKQKIKAVASRAIDRVEAYIAGLKIEQKSYDLYKSHIDQVEGEVEKNMLKFLCEQENSHFEILQESKDYLENPGDWFQKEERWMQT